MSFLDSGEEDDGGDDTGTEVADPNVVNYPVVSSCIARLTYHRDTSDLYLTFQDGRSYVLPGFPEIELERWTQSPSPGGYFNAFVRGNY